MRTKLAFATAASTALFALSAAPIFAHAVVKPAAVGVGAFQTFTLGVPVEKEVATTGVRLVLPGGLNHVTPNVKPGWQIETVTGPEPSGGHDDGDHAAAPVTEITWSQGTIPVGQRDEFLFSAQVPAATGNLPWKVYQTYADGTTVAWDQDPNAPQASGQESTPYSVTNVVDDLNASPSPSQPAAGRQDQWVTYLALALSGAAIAMVVLNRRTNEPVPAKKK